MMDVNDRGSVLCNRCGGSMATSDIEGCTYSACLIRPGLFPDLVAPEPVNPRHLSKSNEHFTPLNVVEAARKTMGGIDLDPATTKEANERRMKATRFFTKDNDDGLTRYWSESSRIFVNPPGGKTAGKSNQNIWWQKLVNAYSLTSTIQAIFISFSIELFQVSQVNQVEPTLLPLDFPFCIPSRRLAYDKEIESESGEVTYVTGDSPPHASAIIYLPESVVAVKRFEEAFKDIGHVCVPRRWA